MKYLQLVWLFVGCAFTFSSSAEIQISGYGSIIAGKTLGSVDDPINLGQRRDETFTADFYDVGQYTNDLSFNTESILSVQGVYTLNSQFSVTTQVVAKGVDDFTPEVDWYYATYRPTEDWTFMAGRRNIPMYYYSEFSEVGYAYPWMRPPANLYWWQITQFNGVHAMYTFNWGDTSNTITSFYGNEYSDDNKEMGFYEVLFGGKDSTRVEENWTSIAGVNWNVSGSLSESVFYDVRFVYFQHELERINHIVDADNTMLLTSQKFFGFGGSVDIPNVTVLFDFNFVTRDDVLGTEYPTYLVSLVYHYDSFHPYISYSKADSKRTEGSLPTAELEEHYISSVGVRYDFLPNIAFKAQIDRFVDQGYVPDGWNYHGDARVVSAGIDFIF